MFISNFLKPKRAKTEFPHDVPSSAKIEMADECYSLTKEMFHYLHLTEECRDRSAALTKRISETGLSVDLADCSLTGEVRVLDIGFADHYVWDLGHISIRLRKDAGYGIAVVSGKVEILDDDYFYHPSEKRVILRNKLPMELSDDVRAKVIKDVLRPLCERVRITFEECLKACTQNEEAYRKEYNARHSDYLEPAIAAISDL
jgi:hypothetical protein